MRISVLLSQKAWIRKPCCAGVLGIKLMENWSFLELSSKTMQSEILKVTVYVLGLESSLHQIYPGSNTLVGAVLILKKKNWKLEAGSKSWNRVGEKQGGKKERSCSESLIDGSKSLGKCLKLTSLPCLSSVLPVPVLFLSFLSLDPNFSFFFPLTFFYLTTCLPDCLRTSVFSCILKFICGNPTCSALGDCSKEAFAEILLCWSTRCTQLSEHLVTTPNYNSLGQSVYHYKQRSGSRSPEEPEHASVYVTSWDAPQSPEAIGWWSCQAANLPIHGVWKEVFEIWREDQPGVKIGQPGQGQDHNWSRYSFTSPSRMSRRWQQQVLNSNARVT